MNLELFMDWQIGTSILTSRFPTQQWGSMNRDLWYIYLDFEMMIIRVMSIQICSYIMLTFSLVCKSEPDGIELIDLIEVVPYKSSKFWDAVRAFAIFRSKHCSSWQCRGLAETSELCQKNNTITFGAVFFLFGSCLFHWSLTMCQSYLISFQRSNVFPW